MAFLILRALVLSLYHVYCPASASTTVVYTFQDALTAKWIVKDTTLVDKRAFAAPVGSILYSVSVSYTGIVSFEGGDSWGHCLSDTKIHTERTI